MLKLDTNDETLIRNWPVIISVPQDGGNVGKHEISADFLLMPKSEMDELLARAHDGGEALRDVDLLRRVVRGIGGVADAQGQPLPYSDELLGRLLNKAYIVSALFNAYFEATTGQKAKRKN